MTSNNSNLFEAAAAGDVDYLKKNKSLINDKNERGWTALHFAARFGQVEAAEFLQKNGADLSTANGEGKTASQVASFWGNDQIAKMLTPNVEKPIDIASPLFSDNYTAVFAGNPLNRQVSTKPILSKMYYQTLTGKQL